ncbi:Gfo/Idh/MocA family oxidoreductase [Lichenihabitans sp. Uapishka_5]|uniref:Gfo/Idh/MocA family protein n=1 Tax=Lichenihabitans sp. Uapishka_5 TaxID=3037302 RepID=UPI0029E7DB72|nr:Gfo/Idh/MocA family oxidoreductase [Lichenihabitans sp. Uapishka_5]MDX7950298.1 Gfo/Idh/MocA family oxidoreductase [Lichenihabitans sp. Uapishka_5]
MAEPTRWALIGATTIAREWMVNAIRQTGGTIHTVMSSDAERGAAFAAEFGIPHATTDLDEVLRDVDAVYISTTNERHFAECMAAAKAGKHVLCEKPLATSYEDAAAMVKACREAGVVMATNHHLRNAATHRAMRDAIAAGRIGTPLSARVVHAGTLPIQMLGWRLHTKGAGAGALLDLLVHDTDLLRFLLGEEPLQVATVAQNGGLAIEGIEDAAMSLIQFSGNIIAQVHDSFTTRAQRTSCEVHGTTGSLVALNNMAQAPAGTVTLRDQDGERELRLDQEDYYVRGCRAFHAAIRGEGHPVVTGEDGLKSLATALAAREAAKSGRFEPIRQSAEG